MPTSLSAAPICSPPAPRAIRTALAALLTTALSLGAFAVAERPAAGVSVAPLSSIRLAAGHSLVDGHGHHWRSDRQVARGGRIERVAPAGAHHVRPRFRLARTGHFAYHLPATPGVYVVHVDLISAAHRSATPRLWASTPTLGARHRRLVTRVNGHRVDQVSFRTRVTSGRLTLRFTGRSVVSSVAVLGLHHLPAPRPGRTEGTPTAPTTSPTSPSSSPTSAEPTTTTPSATPTSTTPAPTTPTSTAPTSTAPTSTTAAPSSPVPTPTTSSSSAAPLGSVTPEDFGAAGNGTTDDTTALQAAFDNAAGRTVYLPAGHVYAHDAVLHLRVAGLHVSGPGTLLATNEQDSSVWIEADGITVDGGVDIKTASTTQRWGAWEQMGVRLVGHAGITLRDITVDGSAAAGIYVGGSHDFVLDHVVVENTRADGIHMTEGAYDGQVIEPVVRSSGDDGVAVVSYKQDGTPCHDITVTSPTVLGTTWGRGLSVVGGQNITETNIDVRNSSAAGVYIAAEGNPWYTAAPVHVAITGGTITGANTDTDIDHGAVLVLSGESDVAPSDVTISNLAITGTRSSASRDLGVIQYGAAGNAILFSNITITGGPASAYQGNAGQASFALRHITQNGTLLADQG